MVKKGFLASTSIVVCLATGLWATTATAETTPASEPVPLARLPYIFDIAIDRGDTSHLLLATRSGLYRAGPDGFALRVSVDVNTIWNLATHPLFSTVLYATGITDNGGRAGLLESRDGGRTWHRLMKDETAPPTFRAVDVGGIEQSTIYGLDHRLWVSRDGGKTWDDFGPVPLWAGDVAVSSLSSRTVYVATGSGLMVSTDGGRTWKRPSGGPCRQPVTAVATGADGSVYAFSLCEGLLRGDERTGEWSIVRDDFGGCIIQHIAVDPMNGDRLYAVERCHRVLASADGGRTWRVFGSKEVVDPKCPTNPYGGPEPYEPDSAALAVDPYDSAHVAKQIPAPDSRTTQPAMRASG